jgi:hypothetical protein
VNCGGNGIDLGQGGTFTISNSTFTGKRMEWDRGRQGCDGRDRELRRPA